MKTAAAVYDAVMDISLATINGRIFRCVICLRLRRERNSWNWLIRTGIQSVRFLKQALM